MTASEWTVLGWNSASLAGALFWALGFYWIFGRWVNRWIDRVSTRIPVAAASLVSVMPFVLAGIASEGLWELYFNPSWAISCAILTCGGCGIFRLGQLDNEAYQQSRSKQPKRRP